MNVRSEPKPTETLPLQVQAHSSQIKVIMHDYPDTHNFPALANWTRKHSLTLTVLGALAVLLLVGCSSTRQSATPIPADSAPIHALDQAPGLLNVSTESPVTLDQIVSERPYTALHFLLKTECPLCIRHTRSYHQGAGEVPQATQIFIKPDSLDEVRQWAQQAGDDGPVFYQDANADLARYLDVPDGYAFHGESVHYPALIVLDPSGREVFRYVGRNNTDRYPLARFKALIADLEAEN